MRIWIDGYEANAPQRLGSSQFAFNLIKYLEKIDSKNDYTVLLPDPPSGELPRERDGWKYRVLKPKRLWTRIALPWALATTKTKPDIFFSPTHYIPQFTKVKRVVSIFDLAFLHFEGMFKRDDFWKLNHWTKYSVENAAHIITISKFSKEDIHKNYGVDNKKITVTYPGYDNKIFKKIDKSKVTEILEKYKISGNYIIYIGTVQPRKNLISLMEAVARIPDLNLVIVGKTSGLGQQGWKYEEILRKPKELKIENRVIFTGYAPTEDLPVLISGAKAFVLVSLWEGFGIPILEAMACGTPVITSNVSSLPEVAGSAGLLVDPKSVDQIEQAIRTIVFDVKLRVKKSRMGLQQVKKFSWEKMAKIVLKTFEGLNER